MHIVYTHTFAPERCERKHRYKVLRWYDVCVSLSSFYCADRESNKEKKTARNLLFPCPFFIYGETRAHSCTNKLSHIDNNISANIPDVDTR